MLTKDSTIGDVIAALNTNGKAVVREFGVFAIRHRAERQGRNPATGEAMTIPASRNVGFKPSQTLKAQVNGGQA